MIAKEEITGWFQTLQADICNALEDADGTGKFTADVWQRPGGGGGTSRVIDDGSVIEKGGVNFSAVYGETPTKILTALNLDKANFYATGVSIVLHPHNPFVPIIHMNVRYFEMSNGTYWFGGGIDLTPHYIDREDAQFFHSSLKEVCDRFDPAYYPSYKKWADDYFYIKHADASRIYGLELEHILSPNRMSYLVASQTLIEEHIAGIPGDLFFQYQLHDGSQNLTRLAKEFVKFNERCVVRLLGDMHATNFVIDVTPDFDELHYRIRAIDFDQQSYEGRKAIYMPQYFKQNNPIIQVGLKLMTPESVRQYQTEEHALMATRVRSSRYQIQHLMHAMANDTLAPPDNVVQLKNDLTELYKSTAFAHCQSMGDLVKMSLQVVLRMDI